MLAHPDHLFIQGARRHADALDRAARERRHRHDHAGRSDATPTTAAAAAAPTGPRTRLRSAFRF